MIKNEQLQCLCVFANQGCSPSLTVLLPVPGRNVRRASRQCFLFCKKQSLKEKSRAGPNLMGIQHFPGFMAPILASPLCVCVRVCKHTPARGPSPLKAGCPIGECLLFAKNRICKNSILQKMCRAQIHARATFPGRGRVAGISWCVRVCKTTPARGPSPLKAGCPNGECLLFANKKSNLQKLDFAKKRVGPRFMGVQHFSGAAESRAFPGVCVSWGGPARDLLPNTSVPFS